MKIVNWLNKYLKKYLMRLGELEYTILAETETIETLSQQNKELK